jgi:hypothetical protein
MAARCAAGSIILGGSFCIQSLSAVLADSGLAPLGGIHFDALDGQHRQHRQSARIWSRRKITQCFVFATNVSPFSLTRHISERATALASGH